MHSGDGNSVLEPHQLGEHLRPLYYRYVKLTSFGNFRIVRCNCRTRNYDFRATDVLFAVTFKDDGAQTGQTKDYSRVLEIRTRNFVAEREKDLGNSAHADATDA